MRTYKVGAYKWLVKFGKGEWKRATKKGVRKGCFGNSKLHRKRKTVSENQE